MTDPKPYIKPEIGLYVAPDGWKNSSWEGASLIEGDGPSMIETDEGPMCDGWPGCDFRLPTRFIGIDVGVNITITGRKPHFNNGQWRMRCRIEWVGDCEPSTFSHGWIYSDHLTDPEIWFNPPEEEVTFTI